MWTFFAFILALIVFLIYTLPHIKFKSIDNLWEEIKAKAKYYHLLDTWMIEHKSLDTMIGFCNTVLSSNQIPSTNPVRKELLIYRDKATNLKNWWNIFGTKFI